MSGTGVVGSNLGGVVVRLRKLFGTLGLNAQGRAGIWHAAGLTLCWDPTRSAHSSVMFQDAWSALLITHKACTF
jgi:hypothetical protein